MNTVVEDTPLEFGKGENKWEPRNYSGTFRKNFTLLEGMERSVNIVAIKTLQKVGIRNLNETVRLASGGEYGTSNNPDFKSIKFPNGETMEIPQNLTAALGTTVVSSYQLSTLYLPFANGGYAIKPKFITVIKNRYGKIVFQDKLEQKKVFDSKNVALITHMMKDVVNLGTGRNAKVTKNGVPIAQGGKTGTTNRQRTAWFAGITPNYVTTVYIGYDDNRPMDDKHATGGGLTAKLWGNYYQRLVDEGYDTGKEFNQITDGLKNEKLTKVLIDSKNGRLADSTSGWDKRVALFIKGTEPTEQARLYNTDFNGFFSKSNDITLDKINSSNKKNNTKPKKESKLNSQRDFKSLFDN
jgi:penicillin-binding protein 1A